MSVLGGRWEAVLAKLSAFSYSFMSLCAEQYSWYVLQESWLSCLLF